MYDTIVKVARMAITTMTTRSSTMVKAGVRWDEGIRLNLTEDVLRVLFNTLREDSIIGIV
jgi:hypothetical protein